MMKSSTLAIWSRRDCNEKFFDAHNNNEKIKGNIFWNAKRGIIKTNMKERTMATLDFLWVYDFSDFDVVDTN